ncbi:MAG: hypothetical protein HYY01_15305, partial [Chloroflexi bacterium]|nr:hypothetical protein [Chloroflexota bacterium]
MNIFRAAKLVLTAVLVLVMMATAAPVTAALPPGLPHNFSGTVTIGANPAAVGTPISARVGSQEYGSVTTTVEGQYSDLLVTGLTDGDTISFYINNADTGQTHSFESGASTVLNLALPDTTPPTAAITYSAAGPYKSGAAVTITATFSEAMADTPVTQIAISGANTLAAANMTQVDTTHYTYAYTVGAGDGMATVALSTGTDAAANVITSAPTSGATFSVDNTAPTLSTVAIASSNANTALARVGDTVTLTIVASESVGTPTVTIGGSAATVTAGSDAAHWTASRAMVSGDTEGAVAFSIAFSDLAGNAGTAVTATTDSSSVTFDKTAPAVTINAVTTPTNVGTQTVTGTREEGATVALTSATATFGTVTNPTTTTWSALATLAAGSNSITATASDAAGNTATATATIVLDTTAPAVTINAVTSPTNQSTQTVTGTREEGATVALTSATATFGTVTNPTTTTWSALATLAAGSNSITATATDAAGNTATASTTIVLDTTAPTVTINAVTSPTNQSTQTVTGTMEGGATVALTSATATFVTVTNNTATTWSAVATLASGSNTITATATDAAGNSATAQAGIVFTPSVTINTVASPT